MIPLGFDPRRMPCVPRTLRVQKPRKLHKVITTTKVSPRGRLSTHTIVISDPVSPVVPKIAPVVPKIAPVVPEIAPPDTDEDYEFVDLDLELAEEALE
jgi:hypothetical protein